MGGGKGGGVPIRGQWGMENRGWGMEDSGWQEGWRCTHKGTVGNGE